MSDYLGPNQTRVLDSTNRNFESIVYQTRKPPLSSEVNLGGKIAAERSREIVQTFIPSGWTVVGKICENLNSDQCKAGDVLCTSDFANAFWLIAQDYGQNTEKNVAIVNGWKVVVQGISGPTGNGYPAYSNTTENNLIRLPAPPESGSRIDFVFLEVWRKLVTPDDNIYPYGNINYHGAPFANDLIDPARGFETSLRIQIQYRIRVAKVDDIDLYPEGFCPSVYVQGPLDAPISTCDKANFTQVPGDPGLWIAGAGDSVAQETLKTVDGHTYAIPMFFIRRRNTRVFDPRVENINGAGRSLADYKNGLPSDRPDNTYNDWIVPDDIVDVRHLVGFKKDLKSMCEQAFRALQANDLKTRMKYNMGVGGEINGSVILKADCIDQAPNTWSGYIGAGDGTRTWFARAGVNDGYYGTYSAGSNGLTQVPIEFLEARKINAYSTMYPIAMKDKTIRVRYGNAANPVNSSDRGRQYNMLRARGGNYQDFYNFGHQMIYHKLGTGSDSIVIDRNISGYNIIGVASVTALGAVQQILSVTRDPLSYTIKIGSNVPSNYDIEMVLYTDNKFFDGNKQGRGIIDAYQMTELKTLETPDGVITNFTLDAGGLEIRALGSYAGNDGTGVAYIESSGTGTLRNLAENNRNLPGTMFPITTMNINFSSPPPAGSEIKVPVLLRSPIKADEGYVFFYNYIPYQGLNSNTVPVGTIEAVGPAITTTAGCGGLYWHDVYQESYVTGPFNYTTPDIGDITFEDSYIRGIDTNWLSTIRPGYLVRIAPKYRQRFKIFKVKSVISDTIIELDSPTGLNGSGYTVYFEAPDCPMYSYPNIIDRFPTFDSQYDNYGKNERLSKIGSLDGNTTLESNVIMRVQGIEDSKDCVVYAGLNKSDRGRSGVYIPSAPYGSGCLGIKFEPVNYLDSGDHYKKTYQSYIFNKDNSGRLYLMVVGSETDNTNSDGTCLFNAFSSRDVVDLFEIPGRPLI